LHFIPRCYVVLAPLMGCRTYTPAPVDVAAHARAFAARLPDAAEVRAFAAKLHRSAAAAAFDLDDGLTLDEGRLLALCCNRELTLARLRAGVARAAADHAGRWPDPELQADVARILERVPHRWLAGGALGITLPLTGRWRLEQALRTQEHDAALVAARVAEADVIAALEGAWVRWSSAQLTADALTELIEHLRSLETTATRLAAAHEVTRSAARAFTLAKVARQVELTAAQAEATAGALEVKALLGLSPDAEVVLLPAITITPRLTDAAQQQTQALGGPRVLLAQRQHAVAERTLALAIRKQWPELTLFPGFGEEDAQPRVTLGLSLPLPLWNANAREIAEATARRAVAAQDLRGSIEHVLAALAHARARQRAAQAQHDLVAAELWPLAEQQLADARQLAELGQLDTLLILDAVHRTFEAKAAAIAASRALAQATIDLNALTWPTPEFVTHE
jgi:outer membrane protein TolC